MARNPSLPGASSTPPSITSVKAPFRPDGVLRNPDDNARERRQRIEANRVKRPRIGTNAVMPDIVEAIVGTRGSDAIPREIDGAPIDELTAQCTKWEESDADDGVRIAIYERGSDAPIYESDVVSMTDLADPMEITFPASALNVTDGEDVFRELSFLQGSGFGDDYPSERYLFEVDRVGPGGDRLIAPYITPDLVSKGVTLDELDGLGGVLPISVLPYDEKQPEDVLTLHVKSVLGATEVTFGPFVMTSAHTIENVSITKEDIVAANLDGYLEFWFTGKDKSGNDQRGSASTYINTLFAGAPTDFKPIRIPLHDNNDLINEDEARAVPEYFIDRYTNYKARDGIRVWFVVTVGGVDQDFDYVDWPAQDDTVVASGPLSYPLLDALRVASGGAPAFSFKMRYEVIRPSWGRPIPALTKVVNCDLTVPVIDPNPETPINENLKPPVIISSGGTENEIPADQVADGATSRISHLAVDDTTKVFQLNDSITLYSTASDGTDRVTIGSGSVTDVDNPFTGITISAAQLKTGFMYFQYSIRRTVRPGVVNTAWSPIQEVVVRSLGDIPGGGDPLPLPSAMFRDAVLRGSPARPSLSYTRTGDVLNGRPNPYQGMLVRVYQYLNMKVGDVIEVTVTGTDGFPNLGTDLPTATFVLKHTVVAADLDEKADTAIPEDKLPGDTPQVDVSKVYVDFSIPYSDIEKIAARGIKAYGSCWLKWQVTSLTGEIGKSSDAKELFATIDARRPT